MSAARAESRKRASSPWPQHAKVSSTRDYGFCHKKVPLADGPMSAASSNRTNNRARPGALRAKSKPLDGSHPERLMEACMKQYHALPAPGLWVEYDTARREADIIWSAYQQAAHGTPWKYAVLCAWYAKCRAIDVLFDTAYYAARGNA